MALRLTAIVAGLLVAAALLFLAFQIGAGTNSTDTQQHQESTAPTNDSGKPDKPKESFWQRATDDPTAVFTLALVVFTFVLAVSTVGLWIATRSLFEAGENQRLLSEQTAERQLRAYVLIEGARVTNLTGLAESDGIPETIVSIKNYGQTPAHDLRSVHGFAFYPKPLPANLDIVVVDKHFDDTLSISVLGPSQADSSRQKLATGVLSQDTKNLLASDGAVIFVYGEIRYRDAFGASRRTKYRYMTGGSVGVAHGGALVACDEGNDSD